MNENTQYRHDLLERCHETAKSLFEQLELLCRESNAYQEEIDEGTVNYREMDEQILIVEQYLEKSAYQAEMVIEADQFIDIEELNKYREDLLEWCNILYSNWDITKPRLVNIVDNESLEGWEELCSRLKEKLQDDLSLDYEDYETANALYEQWENLVDGLYSYQEK
ncbi:hypothetical protein [Neobacillus vireti]|uniref:hypothetical protein n=1 Tax=Neobacillus vireti TaxID=220686 RepID=UPI002FFF9933